MFTNTMWRQLILLQPYIFQCHIDGYRSRLEDFFFKSPLCRSTIVGVSVQCLGDEQANGACPSITTRIRQFPKLNKNIENPHENTRGVKNPLKELMELKVTKIPPHEIFILW